MPFYAALMPLILPPSMYMYYNYMFAIIHLNPEKSWDDLPKKNSQTPFIFPQVLSALRVDLI